MSSFFKVAKKLSATALSYASPWTPSRSRCRRHGRLAEPERDILRALIGVVDQAGIGTSTMDSHAQRVDDELGAHVVGHRPADDPPGVGVLHSGEV